MGVPVNPHPPTPSSFPLNVASFVGNQIKAKEDHLMRLYIFMQFSGRVKFTHYLTADCKRKVTALSSSFQALESIEFKKRTGEFFSSETNFSMNS